MFLDFRSRWAIAGFPAIQTYLYTHENWLYDVATFGVDCIRTQQFKKAREITQRK